MVTAESLALNLMQAQSKARQLLTLAQTQGVFAPGRTESEMSQLLFELAEREFGVKKHWHKRIVRCGENTTRPYPENPPGLTLAEDDMVFVDFGPIFEQPDGRMEADIGRTVVIGHDPAKHFLVAELEPFFKEAKAWYADRPDMTGAELYQYVLDEARMRGWRFGYKHCGHIIGEFPHESRLGEGRENYICLENTQTMQRTEPDGSPVHWILELHLIEPNGRYGAFYEDLLTLS